MEKQKWTKFETFVVIMFLAAWVMAFLGCDYQSPPVLTLTGDTDMDMFKGMSPGNVGGISQDVLAAPTAAVAPTGNGAWRQLVKFVGLARGADDRMQAPPEMLTASVFAQGNLGAGPMVGRAVWGSGNSSPSEALFDVPLAGFVGAGGVLLSVPADVLEISVRNDANLLPAVGLALGAGVAAKAWANVAPGTRGGDAPVTLTHWLVNGAAFVAPSTILDPVPTYAKTFTVFRSSAAQAVTVEIFAGADIVVPADGPYVIAAGDPSPSFDLPSNATLVRLTAPAVALTKLGVIYTLNL